MIPLRDDVRRRRTPWVTIAILVSCSLTFLIGVADEDDAGRSRHFLRWGAIPCELVSGRPLTEAEVDHLVLFGETRACDATPLAFRLGTDGGHADVTAAVVEGKQVWASLLTAMFVHAGWLHLLTNLWVLWVFADNVEDHLGPVVFALTFVVGGLLATGTHVALFSDQIVPSVGASGAIAVVLGIYVVLWPDARLTVRWSGPAERRTIAAASFAMLWVASQLAIALTVEDVSWAAHLGGLAVGLLVGAGARLRRRATIAATP